MQVCVAISAVYCSHLHFDSCYEISVRSSDQPFANNNIMEIDWQFRRLRIWLLRVYIESTSERSEFSQRLKFSREHAISMLNKRPTGIGG